MLKKKIMLLLTIIIGLFIISCGGGSYVKKTGSEIVNPDLANKQGDAKRIVVQGIAQITSSGEQDAFERAKKHALRKAVEKVLGSMVESQTLVENSKLVEDKIYSHSSGFVKKYKILSDEVKGNTKIIQIEAYVMIQDVKDSAMALDLLQQRLNRPRVLVLMNSSDPGLSATVRDVIISKLTEKKFTFVDEGQLKKVLASKNMNISKITGASSDQLAKIAVDAGAQIIIKGEITSKSAGSVMAGSKMVSHQVDITANVIYASDATIIATSQAHGAAVHITDKTAAINAGKKAGAKIADDLINKTIKKWDDMLNNGIEYEVTISGVSFMEARTIKNDFKKKVEGVKEVLEKGFSNNTITLLIKYSGSSSDLAGLLLSKGKSSIPLDMVKYNTKTIFLKKIR